MTQKALLDSQVALWAITDHQLIGKVAFEKIKASDSVLASILTVAELEMKFMAGAGESKVSVKKLLLEAGFEIANFGLTETDELLNQRLLDGVSPFDRIVFAQSRTLGATLFTVNKTIINLGLDWVVDARV